MGVGNPGMRIHARKREGVNRIWIVLVVDQQIFFGDAVAKRDDFEIQAHEANSFVAIFSEDEWLAVFELDDLLAAGFFFGDGFPRAVVENIAILQDFDVGRTLMRRGFSQGFFQVVLEDVHGARDEGGFGTKRERERAERAVHEPNGVDLAFLPTSEVGEYWPLVRP